MNDDEKMARFKEECRSYRFHLERIDKIDQKIKLLDLKMQNVKSPKLDKIGQTPTRHEISYAELIVKKEKLQDSREYYREHVQWVKDTVDAVPSPAYRSLIWATYVERQSLHAIAEKYNVNKDLLYKKRKRFVIYALTDERMQELENIDRLKEE